MHFLRNLTPNAIRGKTALVRVDFNIENLRESFRLFAALPTVSFLTRRGARVVLMSHRGRPKKPSRKESLRIVLPFLKKQLHTAVTFFPRFDIAAMRKRIAASKPRSVFLLENLRFLPGEETGDPRLARTLASLGDLFVNEAFPVCHRGNASVTELPRMLRAYAGLRLEEEVRTLRAIMTRARRPLVVILGGIKVSDKLGVIQHFLRRADALLIGGACANTFLKANGFNIGASLFEPKMLPLVKRLSRSKNIILPVDFISDRGKLLDIGPLTERIFTRAIRKARTVIWNGPLGLFEKPQFRNGSVAVAHAVAASKAFSVVGGGETIGLIHELRLEKRIRFLSTGGGAMLAFLAGEKLPGIEALRKQ